ncbi:DNA-directed RNA polymerase [Lentibacillus sp. JNUCC-1]|uniref:sigma-70 family RNA polymerase sigma factor n=1 Tax=Lentibacillus sp. JNUCC-1 TaxID=2654513 RepID=UPI0013280A04|nr:sigma-70 family RNA polymerase sigma factor [Lentibacillus sp. JNUCC-1]MUV37106.1 DNA-directed RNA polymerase [Lentibacillus sp. JNUCC-1]
MSKPKQSFTFEEVFKQNERRIHYHIHRLNIRDPHQEYFQEGLCALWNAYEKYAPDKGPMATYFNYTIRNRLIDRIRSESRSVEAQEQAVEEQRKVAMDGNHISRNAQSYPLPALDNSMPLPDDNKLWGNLKAHLSDNQWKWVQGYIIEDLSQKEIAQIEKASIEAVKSWGNR